ncbi:MAG: phosphoribosylglycinamide formyltransferase [Methanomassiliicoccaceae archaeon]|jgi:phosphoribosylglycinamide formyltransferase-1|nr:phosphoribosylglycinamide formyltransferase [Methanomassiliicoccaceae archaeon]
MLRLGWFSTGRGPGSRDLLRTVMEKKAAGILNVNIEFVFCNWDNKEEPNPKKEQREMFFDMIKNYGIPLVPLSWKTFRPDLWGSDQVRWRDEYGKEMRELLSKYDFDVGVLAGYMLWVDDETCVTYDLINLHPALPNGPKGTWQEVIWQLIREDATEHGIMIHLCTKEWDRGSALTYCGFSIRGEGYDDLWNNMYEKLKTKTLEQIKAEEGEKEPLFAMIRKNGAKRELPLIVSTIKQFADGNLKMKEQRAYHKGELLDGPFDLSDDVNRSADGE